MKTYLPVLGLVWAASLCGQSHRFNWQNYCFKNSSSPVCRDHDFATKGPAAEKKDSAKKDAAARRVITSPFPSTARIAAPSAVVPGGIDWRFADPFADVLAGFNFNGLSASPLAHGLIAQLAANQGLTEADVQRIFDGLDGLDQAAISVRNNRVVVMITGRVTDFTRPAPEAGSRTVLVSENTMLMGHADAVGQAIERITMKVPPAALTRLAEEQQTSSELWAIGSAKLVGPQALSAGMKRFSLTVSIADNLNSDLAFEFNGTPNANTVRMFQSPLSASTAEENVVHFRTSMEADEVEQKFGQIVAGPLGQPLAALIEAARYLPARRKAHQ